MEILLKRFIYSPKLCRNNCGIDDEIEAQTAKRLAEAINLYRMRFIWAHFDRGHYRRTFRALLSFIPMLVLTCLYGF